MKERPILFSAVMVCAILGGIKTQTRRIVKEPLAGAMLNPPPTFGLEEALKQCPYGQVKDRLWVRETFQFVHANSDGQRNTFKSYVPFTQHDYRWIEYAATPKDNEPPPKWMPSIFMPRWASRIQLEITGVRVERLQDISTKDILAEGAVDRSHQCPHLGKCPVSAFDGKMYSDLQSLWASGWNSINAKRGFGWAVNPLVWVISFRRIGT